MSIETLKTKLELMQRVLVEFPEFRYLGDPILRTKTEEVSLTEGIEVGKQLGEVLVRYRNLVGYGRGLAAPQIGISRSVFVTYLDNEVQVYINPVITKVSPNKSLYRELCLSSGLMWADVKRPSEIEMRWVDSKGETHLETVTGTKARLFQHEHAHLLGIPNLDQAEHGTIEFLSGDPLQEKLREV